MMHGLLFLALSNQKSDIPQSGTRICTGSRDGTYYQMGRGLSESHVHSNGSTLQIVETNGTLDNATRLLSGQCELAIVQEDIYLYIAEHNSRRDILRLSGEMEILLPLHKEQVHILVNRSSGVDTIDQLAGKKVNLGVQNSGTYLTALQITKKNGRNLTMIESHHPVSDSVQMVANGELDAAFLVGGTPIPSLANLPSDANVKLIPASFGETNTWYDSDGVILQGTYPWLTESIQNNIYVRSLLVKPAQNTTIQVGSFVNSAHRNSGDYATRFAQNWEEVNVRNADTAFGKLPISWNFSSVLAIKSLVPPTLYANNFCSGPAGGAYNALADELIPIIRDHMGLTLTKKATDGSLENAVGMFEGDCSFGLLQEDVPAYMGNHPSKLFNVASQASRRVLPLYYEDVLFVVNTGSGINAFTREDLKNKTINLGPKTSGTYATAVALVSTLNLRPEDNVSFTFDPVTSALDRVSAGQIHGAFQVIRQGQSPLRVGGEKEALTNLKFVTVQATGNLLGTYNNQGVIQASVFPAWHNADLTGNARVRAVLAFPVRGIADTRLRNLMETIYSRIDSGQLTGENWLNVSRANAVTHFQDSRFGTAGYHPTAIQYFLEQVATTSVHKGGNL